MTVRIEAPQMGESINEATVASWAKKEGDMVQEDELVAELETEKINLEVTAPKAGKLVKISVQEGDTISPGDLMGEIDDSASGDDSSDDSSDDKEDKKEDSSEDKSDSKSEEKSADKKSSADDKALDDLAPSVRRLVVENDLDPSKIDGTGKGGRITKEDVLQFMDGDEKDGAKSEDKSAKIEKIDGPKASGEGEEERVRMSALRKTIARRLKEAQDTAAMLTTFNEVDLYEVMQLRKKYKEMFKDRHEVGLGFMSFFTKAVIAALKDIPALNAEIDGDDIVYKKHYDIGIAVSTERGLMVPVIRNADKLSFAGVEQAIAEYGQKARKNKIMPDDLIGGTFTITNGGIFGSMLSTPILNTPQVGILGMHNIKERAVVINGEIQVRPMMYLALSYDHRIVDGKEAVTFLVKIKEALEDPARLMIDV